MNDKPASDFEKDLEQALDDDVPPGIRDRPLRPIGTKSVVSLSNQLKDLATAVIQLDKDLKEFDQSVRAKIEEFRRRLGGVI
jgi:hypothetical protein